MSSCALFLKDVTLANEIRRQAIHTAERALAKSNTQLRLSFHFTERFNMRSTKPLVCVRNLDIALRILVNKIDDLRGFQVAMLIGGHSVFIFDFKDPKTVTIVTYWSTDRKPFEALTGRGDKTLYA